MKDKILIGKNITKRFNETAQPVLQHIDVDIYAGDFTVIMGSSGAGKSTLLYALSGMNQIDEGEIFYQQKDIAKLSEKQMAALRANEFGFVFQQTHLVSNLTLFENVAVAGYLNSKRTGKETDERAKQLLHSMHVEHAMDRLPSKVSGGEAQRAAIARAMINEPKLLFADEPTGALNRKNSDEVLSILSELHDKGQSILMVTHDMHSAAYGNRILYLEDGKVLDVLELSEMRKCENIEKEARINQWLTSLMW